MGQCVLRILSWDILGFFWGTSATSSYSIFGVHMSFTDPYPMSVSPFRSGAVVFGLFSSATNLDRKARWGAEMCGAAVNERKT